MNGAHSCSLRKHKSPRQRLCTWAPRARSHTGTALHSNTTPSWGSRLASTYRCAHLSAAARSCARIHPCRAQMPRATLTSSSRYARKHARLTPVLRKRQHFAHICSAQGGRFARDERPQGPLPLQAQYGAPPWYDCRWNGHHTLSAGAQVGTQRHGRQDAVRPPVCKRHRRRNLAT